MSPSTAAPNDTSAGPDRPKVSKASEVGWLFVTHYYTMMNQDPSRLYRFYTNKSAMVHAAEAEETSTSVGQQQIHEKIMSLGLDDTKVVVLSVDSQSSADGGIIVQVLGELSNQGGAWRKFVQTFFLAAQTNGYYVLNDIFRYIQVDSDDAEEPDNEREATAPVAVADTAHAPADVIDEKPAQAVPSQPAPSSEAAPPAASAPQEASAPATEATPAEPDETPKATEPAAPKTWANLAASGANRWGTTAAEARGLSSPASAPAKPQGAAPAVPANKGNKASAPSSGGGQVFVKRLPVGQVSTEALKKTLEAQFGPIKECQLNASKGFAFVEFVQADSARRAIAASAEGAVKLGEATVLVEKRRPHDNRGAGGTRGRGGHRGGYHHA